MRKILFIGYPSSIHDIKWASYFAALKNYEIYFIGERAHYNDYQKTKEFFKTQYNIELLSPISTFSLSKPFRTIKSIRFLKEQIKKSEIDVVHVLFSAPHALWTLFTKKPCLITNRGSDVLIEISGLRNAGVKGKIFFKMFEKAFKKSWLTGTSKGQADSIASMFNKKVSIVRTGVEAAKIKAIAAAENNNIKPIIFSPRYFKPVYNIALQIDAISYLPEWVIAKHKFVFVEGKAADFEYAKKLKAQLSQYQVEQKLDYEIIFATDQQGMFELYAKSALTLMTPISDGTPNSALEAMAARSPLILSNLGYDEDLFKNACLFLLKNTPKDLADLMVYALEKYPADLKSNALNNVLANGNRPTEMKKIELIYDEMLRS